MWIIAAVWIAMALFGVENFQEMYGGTSGLQFFLLSVPIALVPIIIGWWAWRRHRSQQG